MTPQSMIGQEIRKRRKALKFSYRYLGEKAGCSAAFLNDVEFGRRSMSLEILERTSKALGMKLIYTDQTCKHCLGKGVKKMPWVPL